MESTKENGLKIYPLVMAGGHGTRLWPLSREKFPKQFQNLIGQGSLLQNTLKRFDNSSFVHNIPILLCNKEHRFLVAEQLQHLNQKAAIILEPQPRNTAPAIALGALHLLQIDPEAIMLIMPADHWIANTPIFMQAVMVAGESAQQGNIVTFGIKPSTPETGYGYIEFEPQTQKNAALSAHQLSRFVEKPNLEQAEAYIASGRYLWNSGIFCLRADTYIEALQKYQPDILAAVNEAYSKATRDEDFIRVDEDSFKSSPNISIDYAIMEKLSDKTSQAKVIPVDFGWSDIGSWSTIWQVEDKDSSNNVLYGDVVVQNTQDCYVRAEHRLVSVIGMNECVVVETNDAVLVVHKDQVQSVKEVVDKLKKSTRSEYSDHSLVRRPWGSYASIDNSERYQVKRITVKPGASLSLQMHYHRAEHWVVVKGTAQITCGEKVFLLNENQSTYIPFGTAHRLKNPGKIPLELIEVQSGSYLGEDDIIRYEDQYGRTAEVQAIK